MSAAERAGLLAANLVESLDQNGAVMSAVLKVDAWVALMVVSLVEIKVELLVDY